MYKTKRCYSYQVPKYLSKGIPFIVCVCVCMCVHLCTLQFCPQAQSVSCASNMSKKEPSQTAERKEDWSPTLAVKLEDWDHFLKTRAFMRIMARKSCIRPGRLKGCSLFKTGQKSLCAVSTAADCKSTSRLMTLRVRTVRL